MTQYVLNVGGIGRIGFCHNDFGITPNMVPPSSLKFPVFISLCFEKKLKKIVL
jgi:hypothetical protein